MTARPYRLLLTVLALCLLPGLARAEDCAVDAAGAALFIVDGARQIAGLNEHVPLPMASTTKIMTALVALENCSLDEAVSIPDEAVGVEGSSIYLLRGETLSMRDLLYGLMLSSGNDAAVAIAVHVAGSTETFATLMNARAQALGCQNTHFITPNGLHDEGHYTSAHDLGVIACAAMQNEDFCTIVGTSYHQTATGDHTRTFKNKNKTLWQYEGGTGVKTGFTKAAGRCLVFSAERAGVRLVGVVLNCPNMWEDAFKLLDQGFAMLERKRLVSARLPLAVLPVEKSDGKALAVYPKQDILVTVRRDGADAPSWSLALPESLCAPLAAGDEVGSLSLMIDGAEISRTPLIITESAAAMDGAAWLKRVVKAFAG